MIGGWVLIIYACITCSTPPVQIDMRSERACSQAKDLMNTKLRPEGYAVCVDRIWGKVLK